jgi:hypothetical protein
MIGEWCDMADREGGGSSYSAVFKFPRVVAAGAALCVNIILLIALMMPSRGSGGFSNDPADRVAVFFADGAPIVHESLDEGASPKRRRHVGAPKPRAILDVRSAPAPPTETPASVARNMVPDRDATVIDTIGLRNNCQQTYPGEFTSERAKEAGIVLRVYVMPDGRIGQGTVAASSGDEHLDWMTLKCVQVYARLESANDASPTGSWQRLTWHWSQP